MMSETPSAAPAAHASTANKKRALLLLARPGGGKSTVLESLTAANVPYKQLPFRDKLDAEVASGSVLGQQIDAYRKAGALVPNEMVLPLVDDSFAEVSDTEFLTVDGFPRNMGQLTFALERVRHFGFNDIMALYIQTPADTAYSRLLGRGRDAMDLDHEKLLRRMQVCEEETMPLIAHVSRDAERLGIEYHMICGINLRKNMPKYIPLITGN